MDQHNNQKPGKGFFLKDLKWYEHLAAGWPLFLLFVGGAIGGVCGGAAYVINGRIFASRVRAPLKYMYSFLVGIGFVFVYLVVASVLMSMLRSAQGR